MHPGKQSIHFPGPGNVLEFDKIRKCPLRTKNKLWINIMPVKENFDYRRNRILVHSLDIPCKLKLKKSVWIRQLEGVMRRM